MRYRRWLKLVAHALATLVGLAIIVLSVWLLPIACEDVPAGDLLAGVAARPDGTIHVMTVLSHPDDEAFYVGGTLIKLKKDPRVRLHILCATDGGKDEAKDKLRLTEQRLGRIRLKELALASEVLGADDVSTLDYADQGLARADQSVLRQRIRDVLLRASPDIIITHDPFGLSGHPDHETLSRVTTQLFRSTGAQRLFYVTMPPRRYAFNERFAVARSTAERARPTFSVDISQEKRLKDLALHAHATQRHFSSWNGLAVLEDLAFNREHFTLRDQQRTRGTPP